MVMQVQRIRLCFRLLHFDDDTHVTCEHGLKQGTWRGVGAVTD